MIDKTLDSAGLFLSAFISPRIDNLMVSKQDGHHSITEWMDDKLIKYKHFNTTLLDDASLVLRSSDTSEWVALLDEWEQSEDHTSRENCLFRSEVLKKKLPVPPDQVYREQILRKLAFESEKQIDNLENRKADAMLKINEATESGNVSQLAWGCCDLKKLIDKTDAEKELWSEDQISDMRPMYAEGRQTIPQVFATWLQRQRPKSERSDHVGEFKHIMLKKVIPNLNTIGWDSLSSQLEEYVEMLIKKSDTVAEANGLISDVTNWIQENKSMLRTDSVIKIRSAKDMAMLYRKNLKGMYRKISLNELLVLRNEISEFYKELIAAEDNLAKKANEIWKSKITDEDTIIKLLEDLDSLIRAYGGLEDDLKDFHAQKIALQLFKRAYGRLNDSSVTWDDYKKLSKEIEKEASKDLAKEELPWMAEDAIKALAKNISESRMHLSTEWTDETLKHEVDIPQMDVSLASQLQDKVTKPPSYITAAHLKKLDKFNVALEKRLSEIKIEWLVEKYRELSEKDKVKFIKIVVPTTTVNKTKSK